jgi:hypothetical protein
VVAIVNVVPTVLAATFTDAVARALGSALLVAVTVTCLLLATVGAVYKPTVEIVPALADHFTAVLLVFEMKAVNWSLAPEFMLLAVGEIAIFTPDVVVALETATLKLCAPRASLELSTTPIVKSNDPATLGFPLMLPVVAFRLSPVGNDPDRTENWYGELPP